MNRFLTLFGNFFIFALVLLTTSDSALANDGKSIAQKVYDRPNGDTSVSSAKVELYKKGKLLETREMNTYDKDVSSTSNNRMIKFTEPSLIRGTAVLLLEDESGKETTYLYLPALKKERRINGSQKTKRFANTEFTYEDLERREVEQDTHTLMGSEKVFGVDCYVLESTPRTDEDTAYSKRVSWIEKSNLLPRKTHFYGKKGKLVKELLNSERKQVQGYWTATRTTMKNLVSGRETVMWLEDIKYDKELDKVLFHPKRFGKM